MNKKTLKKLLMLSTFAYIHSSCFLFSNEKFKPKSAWSEVKVKPKLSCIDLNFADKNIQISQVKLTLSELSNAPNVKMSTIFHDLKLKKSFLMNKILRSIEEINAENGSESISEVLPYVEFIFERTFDPNSERYFQSLLINKESSDSSIRFEIFSKYSLMTLPTSVEAVLDFRYVKSLQGYLLLTREYIDMDLIDSHSSIAVDENSLFEKSIYKIVARKLTFAPFESFVIFETEGDKVEFIDQEFQDKSENELKIFLLDLGKNYSSSNRFKVLKYFRDTNTISKENVEVNIQNEIADWSIIPYSEAKGKDVVFLKIGDGFSDKSMLKALKIVAGVGQKPKMESIQSFEIRHNSGDFKFPLTFPDSGKINANTQILIQNWLDAESVVKIIVNQDGNLREFDRTGVIEENWSLRQSVLDNSLVKRLWLLFNQIKSRNRILNRICVHNLSDEE